MTTINLTSLLVTREEEKLIKARRVNFLWLAYAYEQMLYHTCRSEWSAYSWWYRFAEKRVTELQRTSQEPYQGMSKFNVGNATNRRGQFWSDEESEACLDWYKVGKMTPNQIAKKLKRTEGAIQHHLKKHGISDQELYGR